MSLVTKVSPPCSPFRLLLPRHADLFDIYGVKAYEPQALTPSKHGDSLGYSETRVVMTARVRVMWIKMAFTQTLLACKQWRDAEGKPCAAPTQQAASTAPGTGSASSQAAILASVAAGDAAANASLGADGGTPPHDSGQSSPAMAGASAGEALACQLEFKLLKSDNAKKFEGVFDLRELRCVAFCMPAMQSGAGIRACSLRRVKAKASASCRG